jgi:hypothetical protein
VAIANYKQLAKPRTSRVKENIATISLQIPATKPDLTQSYDIARVPGKSPPSWFCVSLEH